MRFLSSVITPASIRRSQETDKGLHCLCNLRTLFLFPTKSIFLFFFFPISSFFHIISSFCVYLFLYFCNFLFLSSSQDIFFYKFFLNDELRVTGEILFFYLIKDDPMMNELLLIHIENVRCDLVAYTMFSIQ